MSPAASNARGRALGFGEVIGEQPLGRWLSERVANHHGGQGPLQGRTIHARQARPTRPTAGGEKGFSCGVENMATSTQVLNGRAEVFNDIDLLILIGFMENEVRDAPVDYERLSSLVEIWQRGRMSYCPGVVEFCLDDLPLQSELLSEFQRLLTKIDARLRTYQGMIPASVLNTRYQVPGVIFHDYNTELVRELHRSSGNCLILTCQNSRRRWVGRDTTHFSGLPGRSDKIGA